MSVTFQRLAQVTTRCKNSDLKGIPVDHESWPTANQASVESTWAFL